MANENWQERDIRRQRAIEKAVDAADRIILEASDGTVEETNLLTARVMLQFAGKMEIAFQTEDRRREFKKPETLSKYEIQKSFCKAGFHFPEVSNELANKIVEWVVTLCKSNS
jgi:hypothetical protein